MAEEAARQQAQQQAEAAAQALAQRKAEEAALQEARLALELAVLTGQTKTLPAAADVVSTHDQIEKRRAGEILFIPGPAAMMEIERATLVLKHDIDTAVIQFASAISPYLKSTPAPINTAS